MQRQNVSSIVDLVALESNLNPREPAISDFFGEQLLRPLCLTSSEKF